MTDVEGRGVPPERLRLVAQAREIWRGRLIDLSRRNNLLYFRHLKAGTLDLSSLPGERLAPLLRIVRRLERAISQARTFRPQPVRFTAAD